MTCPFPSVTRVLPSGVRSAVTGHLSGYSPYAPVASAQQVPQAAPAAVADEIHHHRRVPVRARGPQVPRPDAVADRPGELRVVHLDRRVDLGSVPGQRRRASRGAGLVEPPLPPQVEVRRLGGVRAIFTQLVQWQIKPGHWSLRPVKMPESSPTIFLVTADPGARGGQWRGASGVYGNRGSAGSWGDDPPGPPRGSAGSWGD